MSSSGASIRAILPRSSLAVLERLDGGAGLAALEQTRPGLVDQIRKAGILDWIPLECDIELSAIVAEALGVEGDRERARSVLRATLDAPLLRPLVRGAELLFSLEPASILRQAPRGWPLLYRNAGRMRYGVDAGGRRRLVLTDAPAEILDRRVYLEAIAAAIEGVFDLCRVEGYVAVEHVDRAARQAEFGIGWW